jgi:hypothetical protein
MDQITIFKNFIRYEEILRNLNEGLNKNESINSEGVIIITYSLIKEALDLMEIKDDKVVLAESTVVGKIYNIKNVIKNDCKFFF